MNKKKKMFRKLLYYLYHIRVFRFQYISFLSEYLYLTRNMGLPIRSNISLQKDRLFKILNHSINKIPYYKKIAQEYNIKISKNTIFEDIKKFPILTKDTLRKNWKSLHGKLNPRNFSINTSGGTTGMPVRFIQTRKYKILALCSKIVFDKIGGYDRGSKLLKLWGSEKDIFNMSKNRIDKFISKFFRNIIFLNSFRMSDKILLRYIKIINLMKPEVMLAYVQSALEMAKFIKRYNLKIHKFKAIITSAGVLDSKVRAYIENVFNTKVFNRYGSREVSVIGSSCECSEKLHVNMHQKYVEILDDKDIILGEHEIGNIVITDLLNYTMPLIRYKIGDRGSLDLSPCKCGRGLIRLENVYGRVVDLFKTESGEVIDGEYFTHLFYFRDNVIQFQIVQENINEISINLVTINNQKLDPTIQTEITEKIRLVMGNNCNIIYNYKDNIDPSSSGKFRYTISKI